VVLDLPALFTRCYEAGGYDLLLNYQQDPPLSLHKAEAEWVANYLKERGFR